ARYALDTVFPEYYPVGSEVGLVVDGDWVRLVSEPYEIFDWELLALLTVIPGLALLTEGLTGLRRFRARERGAFPVLRVLVRADPGGRRIRVYAADDPASARPLFLLRPGRLESFGPRPRHRPPATGPLSQLREGVLYGTPFHGADVALVAPGVSGVFPVAPAGPSADGAGRTRERARRNRNTGRPVDEVAAEIAAGPRPPAEPRSWSADAVSRGVGVFMLLILHGNVLLNITAEPGLSWVLAALSFPVLVTLAAVALNWRISAGRTGIRVTGAWRTRHIPWEDVTGVRHADDSVYVDRAGADEIRLAPVGFRPLEKRLGTPSSARRAADELRALAHRPELRPLEDPRGTGFPLGPPLLVAGVAVVIAFRLL
ncbi:hypothetical protein ACFW15_25370, partial [Streptomyces sp. NPDC058953]